MRRRSFVLGALGAGVAVKAEAQQPARVYRVGILSDGDLPAMEGLRRRLAQLGYQEGSNLELIYRWGQGTFSRYPALAAELVELRVDALVTYGTHATQGAKDATTTLPIIAAGVGDAASDRFFASLARPGGNVTGFITQDNTISGKRLALLKEAVPRALRMAYLSVEDAPLTSATMQKVAEAAKSFGLSVERINILPESLEATLSEAFDGRAFDAVLVSQEPSLRTRRDVITRFMADRRLPAFYGSREYADAGGLISYGTDYDELFRRAAGYVDRVLRGEKPSELPAQQAERFELVVNMKAAQALGLEIPPSLLARADAVIE